MWCLLHELAHAMTSHVDGRSDGHGPLFMGVYVNLLCATCGLIRNSFAIGCGKQASKSFVTPGLCL